MYVEEDKHVQQLLTQLFPGIHHSATIHHHIWLKVQNTKYTKGVFVLIHYDPISPVFAKVMDVISLDTTMILSLQKQKILFFDSHYNAFAVISSRDFVALEQHSLEFHNVIYPRTMFLSSDVRCYITLPYLY